MANRTIELTPSELLSQACRLEALSLDFRDLQNGIIKTFDDVNKHWSENLSKSFNVRVADFKKDFNSLNESLLTGAKVAAESAASFVDVDEALAKYLNGGDAMAVATAVWNVKHLEDSKVQNTSEEKKNKKWHEIIAENVIGASKAVYKGATNVYSYWVDGYKNHEWMYDAVQYGKAGSKIAAAGVSMYGACFTSLTGVGTLRFFDAMNTVHSAASDIGYIYTKQYDKIGTANKMKDILKDKGRVFGKVIGNEELGETYGNILYTGIESTFFLDDVKDTLYQYGIANERFIPGSSNPKIFGSLKYEDILDDPKMKLKDYLKGPKNIINEGLKNYIADSSSPGHAVIDAIQDTHGVIKKAYSLGIKYRDIVFGGA